MKPRLTRIRKMGREVYKERKKGRAYDPKHMASSVIHSGGSVMAWTCIAAKGTGSLGFIDYVTAAGSSMLNFCRMKAIVSAQT